MAYRLLRVVILVTVSLSVARASVSGSPLNLAASVTGNTVTLTWQPAAGSAPTH